MSGTMGNFYVGVSGMQSGQYALCLLYTSDAADE